MTRHVALLRIGLLALTALAGACGGAPVSPRSAHRSRSRSTEARESSHRLTLTRPSRVGERFLWSGGVGKRTEVRLEAPDEHRIGDSWPADLEALAHVMGSTRVRLDGAELHGQTQLTDVSRTTGTRCFVAETAWTADGFGGYEADLPAGAQVLHSRLEVRTRRELPTDGERGWSSSFHTERMEVRLQVDSPDGPAVMTSTTLITLETSRGFVPVPR